MTISESNIQKKNNKINLRKAEGKKAYIKDEAKFLNLIRGKE